MNLLFEYLMYFTVMVTCIVTLH